MRPHARYITTFCKKGKDTEVYETEGSNDIRDKKKYQAVFRVHKESSREVDV